MRGYDHHIGMPIGLCFRDKICTDNAIGARLVFNNHALLEHGPQALGQATRNNIGAATR